MFRGVLEVVGEEGEPCGAFDSVDCMGTQARQSGFHIQRTQEQRTWRDKTLERCFVGDDRVWEDECAGGDFVDVGRRG